MKRNFDFHVHTNASDGSFAPAELLEKALNEGIKVLAITDQDTISGVAEAVQKGEELGIEVIPGLEISIDFDPGTFHLCGYGINVDNDALKTALEFVQNARRNRNDLIIEKLKTVGVELNMTEIKAVAGPDQIGRPHFARVIIAKGYAETVQEVFDKYLAKGKPGYIDKKRLPVDEAVEVIQGAGGIAVLAHPITLKLESEAAYRNYISKLKKKGLSGLEVCSSSHSDADNIFFTKLADELGLIKTAGSDFHG
ncbi:MAG: PHP domain-containing protein, partial [Desulfobacteraceae bacterium]|nr:PHP domain-containing protein [Desulfobacteraceae bacterium]